MKIYLEKVLRLQYTFRGVSRTSNVFNFSVKLQNRIKRIWSVRTKIAFIEKIFRKKKFADTRLLFMC